MSSLTPEPNLLPPIPEDQRDVPWILYDEPGQMPPIDVPSMRYVVRYQVVGNPWRDDTHHSSKLTAFSRARRVLAEFVGKGHETFSVAVDDRVDPEGSYLWTTVEEAPDCPYGHGPLHLAIDDSDDTGRHWDCPTCLYETVTS